MEVGLNGNKPGDQIVFFKILFWTNFSSGLRVIWNLRVPFGQKFRWFVLFSMGL